MANRFWVGGTGTWDQASTTHWSASSGGASGAAVPVAGDDVFFDTNSGTGTATLSANAPCQSLNSSGSALTTFSHAASVTLTIGDATAGAGSVALDLSGFTTYTLGSTTTSALSFVSTSTTVQTIKTGGNSVGNVTFNGAGGSWQMVDSLNNGNTALVTLTAGTFNTNAQPCSWGGLFIAGSTARTLTITNSSITITSSSGTFTNNVDFTTITSLTLNATGSTITLSGTTIRFAGSGSTTPVWGNIICNTSGNATFAYFTCANFTRNGTAVKTDAVSFGEVIVNGVFTLAGNSTTNRLVSVTSHAAGTQYTITVNGSYSLTNVDFADAKAAGTAGTWSGMSLGDAGNNTNITFDTPVTQTHTASAGGNWSDVTKWTSRVPLPQDNVAVDNNTTGTITADMPRLGKNVDFTNFTGTASFASTTNTMYGSLTLGSGMTVSGTQGLSMAGRSSQTITTNGKSFTQSLTIAGAGGTFTLQDNLTSSVALSVNVGTFDANNKNITINNFASGSINTSIRVIKMGNGTWTMTGTGSVWSISNFPSGNTNFLAQSSTLVINDTSSTSKTFIPGGSTVIYNNISITGGGTGQILFDNGTAQVLGGCTGLTIGAPKTVNFTAGFTYKINQFVATGSSGNVITLQSRTPGSQFSLIQPNGVVSCDWLSIQDSAATGGAGWYAGAHSTNVSDNSGWVFTVPPTPGPKLGTLGVG